jgi:ABC-type amino acid transport substrate-binding protein
MPMDDINLDEKGNEKPMSQQLAVSEPYLDNEIVLVMRADSDAKLSGATLMMDSGPQYIEALDRNNLTSRFSEVQRVNGGAQQCFEALNAGQINAILTDSVALAYYAK